MTKEPSIRDQLTKLQAMVDWFEKQEEVDVEQGLAKVKEGAELIKQLKTRLKSVENEFKEIREGLEQEE